MCVEDVGALVQSRKEGVVFKEVSLVQMYSAHMGEEGLWAQTAVNGQG